jgi:diguanylate cyclase (GGDEF)-like protein
MKNLFFGNNWSFAGKDPKDLDIADISSRLKVYEDKQRILVVDDEPMIRELLESYLKRLGYDVSTVEDGTSAIEAAKEKDFGIFFIDLMMPGDDGFKVTQQSVQAHPNAYVIMITAYATLDNAMRAVRNGAYDFITKPFDLRAIAKIVERIAEQERGAVQMDYFSDRSTKDELTKLYNRHHLLAIMEQEIQRAGLTSAPVSMMLIELDNFRRIHDACGKTFGDRILTSVAHALNTKTRPTDICARYSNRTFAVLLPDTDSETAYVIAEKVRKQITSSVESPLMEYPITASIGISVFPDHAKTREQQLQSAEIALYKTKQTGRNRTTIFTRQVINSLDA